MSKAVFTVASSKHIANAQIAMESFATLYPAWDRVAYILDLEEAYSKGGCSYRPIKEFFSQNEFLQMMFAYPEDILETVVAIKVFSALLTEHEMVCYCEWGVEFMQPLDAFTLQQDADTAIFLVDKATAGKNIRNARFLLNHDPYFKSPVFLLTQGKKTEDFIQFCSNKVEYLAYLRLFSADAFGYDDKLWVRDHMQFYTTWYNYCTEYGCLTEYVPIYNLSFFYTDIASLPIADYGQIIRYTEKLNYTIAQGRIPPEFKGREQEFYVDEFNQNFSHTADTMWQAYTEKATSLAGDADIVYKYSQFSNGTPIVEILRNYYSYNYYLKERSGSNPFENEHQFLASNAIIGDRNLLLYSAPMAALWQSRPDVQQVYPDPTGEHRLGYLHWFLDHAETEGQLPTAYLQPVRVSLEAYKARLADAAGARSFAQKLKDKLKALQGKPVQHTVPMYSEQSLQQGVNLCGYIRGDFGVAEACRILAASLEAAGVPFTIIDFHPQEEFDHTFTNHSWDWKISNQFVYNTNILLTNAPGTKIFAESVAAEALASRYNIGYWYWELPEFPDSWIRYTEYVDEIWTSSEFTADSIRTITQKPVHVVPCCVQLTDFALQSRIDFGLDEDAFVFLMMYDAQSFNDRKNPEGVLAAFLSKFEGNAKVQLAIKVSAPDTWEYKEEFIQRAQQYSNVKILKGTYTRGRVNALLQCCDAFVSLHRSEGFGLGPAEAMYLGKPAIVTNWSGNTQYMTPTNCCPVEAEIIEIQDNFSEYRRGRHWAEPDIAMAADYMQRLVEDKLYYNRVASEGQKTICEQFSAKATGEIAKARLIELGRI